jgi:dCMP deaminase
MEKARPNWDQYFMEFAELARTRTTCIRRGVGAAIVKDNRVIATGYNGVPKGLRHCSEVGCLRQQLNVPSGKMHELCRGLHAEQNAIIQAACMGSSIEGGTIYVTTQPCIICTKMIINAGIKRVVIKEPYPDELAMSMATEAGLVIDVLNEDGSIQHDIYGAEKAAGK